MFIFIYLFIYLFIYIYTHIMENPIKMIYNGWFGGTTILGNFHFHWVCVHFIFPPLAHLTEGTSPPWLDRLDRLDATEIAHQASCGIINAQVRFCVTMVETFWNTSSLKLWGSRWCNPGSFNFDVTFLNLGSQLCIFSGQPVKSALKAKTWSVWRALWVPELQSNQAIPRERWLHKGL